MRYTVVWKPHASRQLAEAWIKTANRAAVTRAADAIDRLLRDAPEMQGEARSGQVRILIIPPLVVVYEIHEADRRVDVLVLRSLRSRPV